VAVRGTVSKGVVLALPGYCECVQRCCHHEQHPVMFLHPLLTPLYLWLFVA
jgi:hypothetical protein